jgi:hypothetical protein
MVTTFSIDQLRRRDDGERVRLYLDQSTMSRLVDDPARKGLRATLLELVRSERIVCPYSHEHTAESILAPDLYEELDQLYEDLCMGIDFHDDDYITWAEIGAAARAFTGKPAEPMWREAFKTDPETLREDLYRGGFRVVARLPHTDHLVRAEVEHAKTATLAVGVYEAARAAGCSFEEQTEQEFRATILRELGWLVSPGDLRAALAAAYAEFESTPPGTDPLQPGHPGNKVVSLGIKKTRTESLVERYPAVAERVEDFVTSPVLATMPMLRFPALMHAALALTPERKPRPGDRFDISHLAKGLSRCDIVTADSGMAALCRDFKLVPNGESRRYAAVFARRRGSPDPH